MGTATAAALAMAIQVTTNVPLQRISDLLCGAFEGGSSWVQIQKFMEPEKYEFRTDPNQLYKHLDVPLNEGGTIIVKDIESDEGKRYKINLETIKTGLQVMADKYPDHFGDFMSENDDATTADVFLNCVCFGEIIYG